METVLILLVVVVLPIWIIFHYGTKARANSTLSPDNEKMMEDLWRSARAMEHRLEALEQVLDIDRPEPAKDKAPASSGSSRVM